MGKRTELSLKVVLCIAVAIVFAIAIIIGIVTARNTYPTYDEPDFSTFTTRVIEANVDPNSDSNDTSIAAEEWTTVVIDDSTGPASDADNEAIPPTAQSDEDIDRSFETIIVDDEIPVRTDSSNETELPETPSISS